MDATLAFATVALAAFSVFTLGAGDRSTTCPADPGYFVDRQAIYACSG